MSEIVRCTDLTKSYGKLTALNHINFTLESGKIIRANFYKCGDLTPQEHYLSWNPMTSETPAFHRPCDFGLLTFEY